MVLAHDFILLALSENCEDVKQKKIYGQLRDSIVRIYFMAIVIGVRNTSGAIEFAKLRRCGAAARFEVKRSQRLGSGSLPPANGDTRRATHSLLCGAAFFLPRINESS